MFRATALYHSQRRVLCDTYVQDAPSSRFQDVWPCWSYHCHMSPDNKSSWQVCDHQLTVARCAILEKPLACDNRTCVAPRFSMAAILLPAKFWIQSAGNCMPDSVALQTWTKTAARTFLFFTATIWVPMSTLRELHLWMLCRLHCMVKTCQKTNAPRKSRWYKCTQLIYWGLRRISSAVRRPASRGPKDPAAGGSIEP